MPSPLSSPTTSPTSSTSPTIVFVHGMFQNPVIWEKWIALFRARHYECIALAWPLHEGEPAALRADPPPALGKLVLKDVLRHIEGVIGNTKPVMIGHSIGGLVMQIMMNRGLISHGIAISSVAPNAMFDFDWGFLKNSAVIANPLKGDDPIMMDAETFRGAFANTLTKEAAAAEFARTATHDSRNVLRDGMGADRRIDLETPHGPLLLIGAEKDEIIPAHLNEKNASAYEGKAGDVDFREFAGRSHYICGEPGWEEVADYATAWLDTRRL
ncbi:MAG: hypothetical protein JWQ58_1001 [Reyranella sp.]|nr:hypothetical protein [Reyranella sp.]